MRPYAVATSLMAVVLVGTALLAWSPQGWAMPSQAPAIAPSTAKPSPAEQHPASWSEDLPGTLAASASTPILVLFTGSDWCPPCQRLERVVFSSATFARWWPGRLRLVKIDFTRTPPMTPAIEQARMELARRYGVTGFPTVLFLAADGRELGRLKALGPFDLGPDRWLAEADRLLNITP